MPFHGFVFMPWHFFAFQQNGTGRARECASCTWTLGHPFAEGFATYQAMAYMPRDVQGEKVKLPHDLGKSCEIRDSSEHRPRVGSN